MRTESYIQYWERQISESEKRIAVAQANLARIALQPQLTLFDTQAEVIRLRPFSGEEAA
jgi:hypothetical protein